ncbi:MAG: ubiquinol-cytochrome c reductase iron-sulfur subunit, partial [Candidatus Omnitrophica bacterium]|nr:ubiquinol-cytochrome c reductase iron-sulfur subunit [Candidatus Omnitrophota bacterium]
MTNHHPTPRSEEPQDIQKRNFLKGLTGAILGFMTFFLAIPFISYLVPAAKEGTEEKFSKVPNFPSLPVGKPTKLTFEYVDKQGFITSNVVYDVWVIKHAPDKATVYSPLCPHLNCRYNFVNGEFACPCHGSVFNEEGKVLGGPAPRPLDTLPYKIQGGELYVQWELFKAGVPEK